MTPNEQKKAAREFAAYWKDKGYEKGQTHAFWLSLLCDVFGVEHPEQFIQFENPVLIQHMSFIDGYIPASRVMIEQKGSGKDLRKGIKQSDGSILTPFQQAQRYIPNLPVELHPRYIIACNFQTFLIYDMSHPLAEPAQVQLADLEKEYYRLAFIAEGGEKPHLKREVELSVKAGELVGKLYDALYRQYAAVLGDEKGALSADVLRDLNKLCVRLVFCFYAEDACVFGRKDMFHDYLASFHAEHARGGLVELFKILDQPESERDPFLNEALAAFPYVNGGLFSGAITIPRLDQTILSIILDDCCDQFDWSEISPTIFGAVFESTLNPETRRSGGMHYTSIENIHKVIDPLFLDALKDEYAGILELKTPKARRQRLAAFQDKLATLTFFDPACGSGNFLTETYLSLRAIENDLLRELLSGGDEMGGMLLADIKVSISQFYGIEINDFAVAVAKTALWIAESQMMNVTESIIGARRDFLPLKTNANIVEGNALKLDWSQIVPPEKLSYIMGNPPFVGYSLQTPEQKADMLRI
ncbi:MAG: class I SAM-dependent DNA methyltransferase, partial [Pyramidobacter sp.]|nr:class I SAM-dependent DNA methyltransferase [Pyramidobacter sp.]